MSQQQVVDSGGRYIPLNQRTNGLSSMSPSSSSVLPEEGMSTNQKVGASLVGGSVLMDIYGQYMANKAEAEAYRANAKQLYKQIGMVQKQSKKESELLSTDYDHAIDSQMTMFTRAGVSLEGSPLNLMAQEIYKKSKELLELDQTTYAQVELMKQQAKQLENKASEITSFGYQALGGFSSLLKGGTQVAMMMA